MAQIVERFLRRGLFAFTFSVFWVSVLAFAYLPATARQQTTRQSPSRALQNRLFTLPESAAAALYSAAQNNDDSAVREILGANPKRLEVGDKVFAQRYKETHTLVSGPDGTETLYVGADNWPVPIPLVAKHEGWLFDAVGGNSSDRIHTRVPER